MSSSSELSGVALAAAFGLEISVHPDEVACEAAAASWAVKFNALGGRGTPERIASWAFARFSAGMYPKADAQWVVLAADLTNWIAVLDDLVEKHPERTEELRAAHLGEQPPVGEPSTSLVRAWGDLEARICAGISGDARARVRANLALLFSAYAWEASYRMSGRGPPLEEYRQHRHESGGVPIYLMVLEAAVGGRVHDASWLSELNHRIGTLACYANDLCSHDWDRASGNPINLVRVLEDAGERQPVERAVALATEEWLAWKACSANTAADPSVMTYVRWQPYFVSGTLRWMDKTQRYLGRNLTAR